MAMWLGEAIVDVLSELSLSRLPEWVRRPLYARAGLRPRIVHVGVGAFHRCHQAEYIDDLAELHGSDWGIVGVNIREPDVIPRLATQDGLYTRVLRDERGDDTRVIGSMISTLPAGDNTKAIATLRSPTVDVAMFTVTEKGYCHVPATGEPDLGQPDLVHDLDHPTAVPRSLPGVIAAALDERRGSGASVLSLVSCDNVPANGAVLERMVREVAGARSPTLPAWIADNVGFVSTMVDRIVPATAPDEAGRVSRSIGLVDEVPVVGEPFRQWVISDDFRGSRPDLELVGVEFTSDVEAYEILKMRVVNGAQSMLAYLGALAGITHIFESMAHPQLRRLVETQLAREVQPCLPPVRLDVDRYRRTLIDRLANPTIGHTSHQIATDGSRKIVPRFVAPITAARAAGGPCRVLALGLAAWMKYQEGVADDGSRFDVSDPASESIVEMIERAGPEASDVVGAVLGYEPVFGDLGRDEVVAEEVTRHLASLRERGTLATVETVLSAVPRDGSKVGEVR